MKLRYSFSEKEECQQIHEYSLDILENTVLLFILKKQETSLKKMAQRQKAKRSFSRPKS